MKYLISNPNNATAVEVNGVMLQPGYQLEVTQAVGEHLKKSYDFLQFSWVEGKPTPAKAKPVKLAKPMAYSLVTHDDPDVPDFAIHGPMQGAKKAVAKRKPAAKKKKQVKKAK